MKCTFCGNENKKDKFICEKCGNELNGNLPIVEINEEVQSESDKFIIKDEKTKYENIFKKIYNSIKEQFINLKNMSENRVSIFNLLISMIVIIVVINICSFIFGFLYQDYQNPKVFYESLNTLYTHNSMTNKITAIADIDSDFDMNQVKSSNENAYVYYPYKQYMVNGIPKFDLVKAESIKRSQVFSEIDYSYFVSNNGRNIVYFDNVLNIYGENVANLYYIDTKKDGKKIKIAEDVIVSSVALSENSKELMYITSEDSELFKYKFSNKKSRKIESGVTEVLYYSENLKNIVFVKYQKQVSDFDVYNLYAVVNDSVAKLASGILKESVHCTESGVIYLKLPKEYPRFEILTEYISGFNKSELKLAKENFDRFVTENIFSLYEIDFKGKSEMLISDDVYSVNFISENGEDIIFTKYKEFKDIDVSKFNKIEDIASIENLVTVVVDINREFLELERTNGNELLSTNENYGFDTITSKIYYIDSGELIELAYSDSYTINDIDNDVKKLWYYDDILYYLKKDNSLVSFYRSNEKDYFAENVIVDSIVLEENRLYYQIKDDTGNIGLYVKVNGDKVEKLCDNLAESEIVVFGQYAYFTDKEKGLLYYNGSKVRRVDQNANEVYKLENN